MSDTRGGAFTGIARKGHGRAAMLASIARDARLTRGYVLQVILATAIAHLGLLMNSSPVIIGAMLISPLLAPIMGFGFAVATFDERLLRRSLQTLGVGTAVAIGVAAVLTGLSPITDATPAILARVRPSLLDLMVAIFGGVAGAYALLRRFSATLVGVAIATALIPPLATVGWALALGRHGDAGGALLLYVTNTAAIGFMATVVARFNGFGTGLSPRQTGVQSLGIVTALAVLAVPLAFSLSAIVREARSTAQLRAELASVAGPEATIDRFDIDYQAEPASIAAVVITPTFVPALEKSFAASARRELGDGTRIAVIQLRSGSAEAETRQTAETAAAQKQIVASRESQRLRASLTAAYRTPGAAILIDTERRTALVRLDPRSAVQTDPAPLRAAFPDWRVEIIAGDRASIESGDPAPAQGAAGGRTRS